MSVFLALSICGTDVVAQTNLSDRSPLFSEDALKQSLKRLESEPENFDLLWQVVSIASQQGAYDEAITALERLLIYFPRDPKLRIELGVMYYRLGSYNQANRQFELARTLSPTPEEIRRLERFEPAVRVGQRGLRFSNAVILTYGSRSNILTTATGPSILSFDAPIQIGPVQSGTFFRAIATSKVTWTLDNPRADQISARARLAYADFDGQTTNFDTESYGLELAYQRPVFLNFEGYAIDVRGAYRRDDTNRLGQSGAFDLWEMFLGGSRKTNLSRTTLGYSYTQAEQAFGSSLKTGVVKLGYSRRISPRWNAGAGLYAGQQRGNNQPSQDLYGLSGYAEYHHKLFGGRFNGKTRISVGYDVSRARAVTPSISSTTPLDTDRVIGSISEEISFKNGFDLRLNVQSIQQHSNLPNGRLDDLVWSMSLRKRF